eukprot:scaffold2936_cov113-Cylindrotheca_fusiformis.AAC.11
MDTVNNMGNEQEVISGPEYRSIRMQSSTDSPVLLPQARPMETKMSAQHTMPQHEHQQWDLPKQLPAAPEGVGPLHAYIQTESPQIIADRIHNLFVSRTIAIHFSDTHKVRKCDMDFSSAGSQVITTHCTSFSLSLQNSIIGETSCGVKVAVNLYATPSDADDSNVLVEVQRRVGCSYIFHLVAVAILQGAQGLPVKSICPKRLPLPSCIPQSCIEERKQLIQKDTEKALQLVRSERLDAQLLGLESLESLSSDCYAVSLLHNEETIATLQSFLIDEESTCIMKRRALGVLANIIQCNSLSDEQERVSNLRCPDFMGTLLANLKNSESSPHEALQATRCLQRSVKSLCNTNQQRLASILKSLELPEHSQLQKESEELKSRLETTM